jgi:hypothetical protein
MRRGQRDGRPSEARQQGRTSDQAKPGGAIGDVYDRCSTIELLRAAAVDDGALCALARRAMDPTPIDPMRQRRSWR